MSDLPCKICGGAKGEHGPGKTQHIYTVVEGDLRTHKQAAEQVKGRPGSTPLDRLLTTLVDKGLLTPADIMFIVFSTSPTPSSGEEK